MATQRINLNIDERLLAKIDAYANAMGVNRTAAICFLCSTQLMQSEALTILSGAVDVLNKQEDKP